MRLVRFLPLLALGWAQACAIYNEGLLGEDDDNRVEASGGRTNSGGRADSGGSTTGGRSSGGASSGGASAGGTSSGGASAGGASSDGGEGGEGSGGESSGGASSGGSGSGGEAESGGASSGGAGAGGTSSGGASSGGASSGGATGTGGTAPTGPFLITDMQTNATYSSPPFSGAWDRYQQTGTTWAALEIEDMFVLRSGSTTDFVLRAAATFASDDWGIDLAVTLKSGNAISMAPYAELSFDATRVSGTNSRLRVALEDEASHRGSSLCTSAGVGADCDKHAEASRVITLTSGTWQTVEIPLTTEEFSSCGPSCTRANPLDLTKVYAIHFKMDPTGTTSVDFSLDNVYVDD